jgi:hypothetical protein
VREWINLFVMRGCVILLKWLTWGEVGFLSDNGSAKKLCAGTGWCIA